MKKLIQKQSLKFSSLVVVGMFAGADSAFAGGDGGAATANNFNNIAKNAMAATSDIPGLVTGVSYMVGILLSVLGILKIKDHVENPGQTPLKDGIARVTIGGGLFAVPIVTESMTSLLEGTDGGTGATVAAVNEAELGLR